MYNPEILEAIDKMSVMDLNLFIEDVEKKFNVTSKVATQEVATVEVEEKAIQTEFTVVLTSIGENKVGAMKVVKELLGLTLLQAKAMVEGIPATLKESISKADSDALVAKLQAGGLGYEVR